MNASSEPLIDYKNPFYCPKIPASVYLRSLRRKVEQLSRLPRPQSPSISFGQMLERSSRGIDSETMEAELGSDWNLGDRFLSGNGYFSDHDDSLPPYSPVDASQSLHPRVTYRQGYRTNWILPEPPGTATSTSGSSALKRRNFFSDLNAPPKYARSIQSFHDSSFDIELKRENLRFSEGMTSSPSALCSSRAKSSAGASIRQSLTETLSLALPGIRLLERLESLESHSTQVIMSFLSKNGYINERVLDIFSRTDVDSITLAPSMFDENGLNIGGGGIYSVFGRVNCFQSLRELSFAGISIRDSDIRYIHHLPNLSVLLLGDTTITNEAVFLLMSLKRSLTRLCLATNPDINNDSVPAIALLSGLRFLSIIGTSIDMVGLRRLAEVMKKDARNMDVEIPIACEVYVANLNTRYLCMPAPPLITDPDACAQLSVAALKRNLEAHAACNQDILASGTRQEMIQRLTDILKTRNSDALVMSMLEEGVF